ncbi:MAG: sulfite exporter TauE/SafE family protein [Bernardetiaceae bacterium]
MDSAAFFDYGLLLVAGLLAGGINTLAGNGSVITLSSLRFLGQPMDIANGTNRVGVLIQSTVALVSYWREAKVRLEGKDWLIAWAVVGGLGGTWLAVVVDPLALERSIGILMIGMLVLILNNPKAWLSKHGNSHPPLRHPLVLSLMYAGIGFYAGYVQAGVGIILLVGLVAGAGYSLTKANALKLIVVVAVNFPALFIFWYNDQVHWLPGLVLAAGQSLSARWSVRFAVHHPKANFWIRNLLILIVLIAIVRFLRLYETITF